MEQDEVNDQRRLETRHEGPQFGIDRDYVRTNAALLHHRMPRGKAAAPLPPLVRPQAQLRVHHQDTHPADGDLRGGPHETAEG